MPANLFYLCDSASSACIYRSRIFSQHERKVANRLALNFKRGKGDIDRGICSLRIPLQNS